MARLLRAKGSIIFSAKRYLILILFLESAKPFPGGNRTSSAIESRKRRRLNNKNAEKRDAIYHENEPPLSGWHHYG